VTANTGHPIFPIRLAPEIKAQFQKAAAIDGEQLSTWFRSLAMMRVRAQAGCWKPGNTNCDCPACGGPND
jgi:hypothetical protein